MFLFRIPGCRAWTGKGAGSGKCSSTGLAAARLDSPATGSPQPSPHSDRALSILYHAASGQYR
jgi:hypothetical protein